MDQQHTQRNALIRTLVAAALVFVLLQTTRMADALSWLTRPAVAAVIALTGGHAADEGTFLIVGDLRVPWSRDCAGFDVLLVLWGLIIWTSRHEIIASRFWWRMLAAVPAAVVANVARVLTIIAWRQAFYPAVESPQMHYFIGFVWLLPLLAFFIPRGGRPPTVWLLGMILPAAALSLTAPQAGAPGGYLVTACALVLLASQHVHSLEGRLEKSLALLWILAAVFIAEAGMESLWLPWVLSCPWCMPRTNRLRSLAVLLPGTIPLFAMKLPWLIVPALLWGILSLWHSSHTENKQPLALPEHPPRWATTLLLSLMLLVPFTASTIGPVIRTETIPPSGLMARKIESGTWLLRLTRQSPDISINWFSPSGSGRHHTLPVCLAYRGKVLHPDKQRPAIFTDGEFWFAEAFLMPDGQLHDYDGYLRRTLIPFTSAGVHLIASTHCDRMNTADFEKMTRDLFARVAEFRKSPNRLSNQPELGSPPAASQ